MSQHLDLPARFLHEPRTEQEVVCLFVTLIDEVGVELQFPFLIETVRTVFPDCIIQRLGSGDRLHIEFELDGIDFLRHRKRPERCDVLVCWHDNWGDWSYMPSGFRVVQLSETVKARSDLIVTVHEPPAVWDEASFMEQARRDGVSEHDLKVAGDILRLAAVHHLGPHWLSGRRAVFVVGDDAQFFKVWSNGHLALPFSRLKAGHRFEELAVRLNDAILALKLEPGDARSKGKGGQLSDLFPGEQEVRKFFGAWQWFRASGGRLDT